MSGRTKALSLVVVGLVAGLVLGSLSVAGAAPDTAKPQVFVDEIGATLECPGFGQGRAECSGDGICELTGEECVPGENCPQGECLVGGDCAPGENCAVGERAGRGGRGNGGGCGGGGCGGGACGGIGAAAPITY